MKYFFVKSLRTYINANSVLIYNGQNLWRSMVVKISVFFLLTSCGSFFVSNNVLDSLNSRTTLYAQGPAEATYCQLPNASFGTGARITGLASFQFRPLVYTASTKGLGDVSSQTKPIRHAEVRVFNLATNQQVQCGETDQNGNFDLELPALNTSYEVRVYSRSFNNYLKASVMLSPDTNYVYEIKQSFVSQSGAVTRNLVAPATGSLEAGAFSILDTLLKANEFLKAQTSGCFFNCMDVSTGLPKVEVFWEKGFNPGVYYSQNIILSFNVPGTTRLFILGGVDGDVNFSDTDHFDESIILHEYFHFIEHSTGVLAQQGGQHSGNEIIDPRLAWSEGAAQFFQGAILGVNRVLDTIGNSQGNQSLVADFSLENQENDIPVLPGEGEFREFSVARLLWDYHDDTPFEVGDQFTKGGFLNFWSILTGDQAFGKVDSVFQSMSLFHQFQQELNPNPTPENDLSTLRSQEYQLTDREQYGQRLSSCITSETFNMEAPFFENNTGQFSQAHLLQNNDFKLYTHTGGPLTLRLNHKTTSGGKVDLDLYLLSENYRLGDLSNIVGLSQGDNISAAPLDLESETVYIGALEPGNYMVNIHVAGLTDLQAVVEYSLEISGSGLCSSL